MNESLSEPEEETRICPHCGNRVAYGVLSCPTCGKQITGVHSTGAVKRPLSLTIIAAIWFLVGLLYILNSISVLIAAPTVWTYLFFALGVIYASTAFGLWTGKRWSYNCAFIAAGIGAVFGIVRDVWTSQMPHIAVDLAPLLWAVVVWYYVRKPDAKKYLGVK